MKEIFLGILFSIIAIGGISGQKTTLPTASFTIEGAVEKPVTITLDSLLAQPVTSFDNVVITNHLGERKSVLKGLKAVSLLPFLEHIHIQAESPKQLSEFYFVFEAVDGYKVVYSWNELFNSQKGREVYAIIGKEGKPLADLPDRIAVITPTDFMTGRRYVKSLSKIKVLSAD